MKVVTLFRMVDYPLFFHSLTVCGKIIKKFYKSRTPALVELSNFRSVILVQQIVSCLLFYDFILQCVDQDALLCKHGHTINHVLIISQQLCHLYQRIIVIFEQWFITIIICINCLLLFTKTTVINLNLQEGLHIISISKCDKINVKYHLNHRYQAYSFPSQIEQCCFSLTP